MIGPTLGRSLLALWALSLPLLSLWSAKAEQRAPFLISYAAEADERLLPLWDFSILDISTKADLRALRAQGHRSYGYISVVEIAPGAAHRADALNRRIPVLGRNEDWNSELVDITHPEWSKLVLERLAPALVEKGFSGFFLDTVESVETLAERYPARADALRRSMVTLIKELRRRFPQHPIILNRGFRVWEDVREEISGVLIESLFQTYDFKTKSHRPVSASDTEWLLERTRKIRAAGLDVLVVDYCDRNDRAVARRTAERISALDYLPFVTTHHLNGASLAPLRKEPRRILTLFGNQEPDLTDRITWPADSGCARLMQMPLEYLGYEIDYLNVNGDPLPHVLGSDYAAVLLDPFLSIPRNREAEMARWLVAQKNDGRKVLFSGTIPFSMEEPRKLALSEFGFQGTGEELRAVREARVAKASAMTGFEARIRPQASKFFDLRPPTGSQVELSIEGLKTDGSPALFEPVFTASWGGAALNPHLFFRGPDFVTFWLIDPFSFFKKALEPAFPVPDHTTRNGRRIFFAHIDGDGFRHKSAVMPGKTSAEVTLDRIIKKYPLPITVSVIESEMRGLITDQKEGEAAELVRIAREIFNQPNVQAASHTYSHPFYWIANGRTAELYPQRTLELRPPHVVRDVDYEQEVTGSLRYIEEHLLPAGKKAELMLWSGDCRPPPEALAAARKAGVENMNGGSANISRKHPTLTRVSGRGVPWGGEWQIFACGENENIYLDGSNLEDASANTLDGGFIHNIEAYEKMGSPRRLKPVNIYFHFYSADRLAPMNALTAAFEWSMSQPLAAITAAEYARIARDCRDAALLESGPGRWLLVSNGSVRTFRLNGSVTPDMERSRGIIGFSEEHGGTYVHTDGSPRAELWLSATRPRRPYLRSSSGQTAFSRLDSAHAQFSVRDYRPVQTVLAGFSPNARINAVINGERSAKAADAEGALALELPAQANVTLTATGE